MPVQIPQECRDIEPLVRELEGEGFNVVDVRYEKDINFCDVLFQHKETEKLEKEIWSHTVSKIRYFIPYKRYDITLVKHSKYPFSVDMFGIPEKSVIYVTATFDKKNDVYESGVMANGLENPNIVKYIISGFYKQEIYRR